jgi:hypothetical protein
MIWLGTETGCGFQWKRYLTFWFHISQGLSLLAAKLSASQEGVRSIESVKGRWTVVYHLQRGRSKAFFNGTDETSVSDDVMIQFRGLDGLGKETVVACSKLLSQHSPQRIVWSIRMLSDYTSCEAPKFQLGTSEKRCDFM